MQRDEYKIKQPCFFKKIIRTVIYSGDLCADIDVVHELSLNKQTIKYRNIDYIIIRYTELHTSICM